MAESYRKATVTKYVMTRNKHRKKIQEENGIPVKEYETGDRKRQPSEVAHGLRQDASVPHR